MIEEEDRLLGPKKEDVERKTDEMTRDNLVIRQLINRHPSNDVSRFIVYLASSFHMRLPVLKRFRTSVLRRPKPRKGGREGDCRAALSNDRPQYTAESQEYGRRGSGVSRHLKQIRLLKTFFSEVTQVFFCEREIQISKHVFVF